MRNTLGWALTFLSSALWADISLPVRVMPLDPAAFFNGSHVEERSFTLTAGQVVALTSDGRLYLQGHGLGYRDGNELSGALIKDGKASVQINNGAWIDLCNSAVEVAIPERFYGGIGGSFRTVRLEIPLTDFGGAGLLLPGQNSIRFRFNGTDGTGSGYRILDLDLRSNGVSQLDRSQLLADDPDSWTAPRPRAVSYGATLFRERNLLRAHPGAAAPTLVAACSDCHAQDGRDLEYYSYSNLSIVNRSVFHGLSEAQGEAIASYLRSHSVGREGRPWDPPYQPGPGIDSRPRAEERWAAGAGLTWALDHELDRGMAMASALFPQGGSQAALVRAIKGEGLPASTVNLRELPVAIQLPDWNSWLPEVHPIDLWGEAVWQNLQPALPVQPQISYEEMRLALQATPTAVLIATGSFVSTFGRLNDDTRSFVSFGRIGGGGGGPWRTNTGPVIDRVEARGYKGEFAKRNLAQWQAVKYWELAHEFGIEALGPDVWGADGEQLSWPIGDHQSVHQVAAHITSDNRDHYTAGDPGQVHAWQLPGKGDFDSTAWYHLQLILNAGPRNDQAVEAVQPIDWAYGFMHIYDAAKRADDLATAHGETIPSGYVWEGLRYTATLMKAYQMRDNGKKPRLTGWALRDVSPRILLGEYRGKAPGDVPGDPKADRLWTQLDVYQPGMRARLAGAYLRAYLDKVGSYAPGDWVRYDPDTATNMRRTWWTIEPADEALVPYPGFGKSFASEPFRHGESFYRALPLFQDLGVEQAVLDDLAAWGAQLWPGPAASPNDWAGQMQP